MFLIKQEFDKYFGILTTSKSWQTFVIAGIVCLIAVMFQQVLFLLALIFFGRAIWLAWPLIKKEIEKNK